MPSDLYFVIFNILPPPHGSGGLQYHILLSLRKEKKKKVHLLPSRALKILSLHPITLCVCVCVCVCMYLRQGEEVLLKTQPFYIIWTFFEVTD